MKLLALDPGTTETAFVVMNNGAIIDSGHIENDEIRQIIDRFNGHMIACEMIQSFGMPVGKETFETCLWIGRFLETSILAGVAFELIYRKDIKMHLCGSMRAKDGNIRQALIDRLGAPGTKNKPGATYGIKSHTWAALAVGVYAMEKFKGEQQ